MKCEVCNSEKIVNAGVGFYCHDCEKLYFVEEMRTEFTKALIERAVIRKEQEENEDI